MKKLIYLSLAALMVLAVSCKKDPKVGTPSVRTLAATEIGPESARLNAKIDFAGVSWSGVNYGFYWGTSEDQEGTYIQGEGNLTDNGPYSAVITGLAPETEYWFKAFIEIDDVPYTGEILNFTTDVSPIPEGAVDLGIEMTRGDGTKYKLYWAKSNLSEDGLCANPEDYGDYYAWGETEPYYAAGHSQDDPCENWKVREDHPITGYNWKSYKWFNGSKLTKYNTNSAYGKVDDKEVLDPEDDVAYVKLNGQWRMPTDEEWNALMNECDWTWTTQNGVNGRLVKSKTNGNNIFLPAAGCRIDLNFSYSGFYGGFWSSSLCTDESSDAWYVYFSSDVVNRNDNYRSYGFPIRPVWEE